MRRAWLIALCGCRSILGIEEASPIARDGDPSDSDGFVFEDAAPDANVPGQVCFGQAKVKACVNAMPTNTLTLSTAIDTSVTTNCTLVQPQAAPPSLCVIVAGSIMVPVFASVRITGNRPLVLIAADSIIIDGKIDVASHRGAGNGAGANTGSCTTAQSGGNGIGGAGGAAGGALGGTGGAGGSGGTGASGAATAMPTTTTVLRGGCAGAKGGDASIGVGGAAGAGGGALYLLASGRIQIEGTVNASGAAAGAPGNRGGGGGGGAGGMIGLEAPLMMIGAGAQIYAVGGGGSSGGGSSAPGNAGAEADGPAPTTTAPGAGTSGTGGAGGAESGGNPGGVGSTTTGGGGGGGSAGIIWAYPTLPAGGMFAPMPRLP